MAVDKEFYLYLEWGSPRGKERIRKKPRNDAALGGCACTMERTTFIGRPQHLALRRVHSLCSIRRLAPTHASEANHGI